MTGSGRPQRPVQIQNEAVQCREWLLDRTGPRLDARVGKSSIPEQGSQLRGGVVVGVVEVGDISRSQNPPRRRGEIHIDMRLCQIT